MVSTFDSNCAASARNKVFPAGLTEQMVAADPDLLRVRPVGVTTFWDDLEEALEFNPVVGADDAPMADQARTLLALRKADPAWKALIDHAALEADAELHDGAKYHQVGSMSATAGSGRRTLVCGAPTGSPARRQQ